MKPQSRICPVCDNIVLHGSCVACGFHDEKLEPQPTPAQGFVSDTPETDEHFKGIIYTHNISQIDINFARTLERERDALLALIKEQVHTPKCHLNSSRPFSETAREEWDKVGCTCWKSKTQRLTQKEKKV